MDQPQHQVFGTGGQSYRYMTYPFQKQPLQLLYPGRVMKSDWHYTGENIPNEDPVGLAKTQYQTAALARAAKIEQEALARHLGGRDKIAVHPAVEPEAVTEDPAQTGLSIRSTPGLEGDLDIVGSKFDNLSQAENRAYQITSEVRKSLKNASPAPLSKESVFPRYDWKASGVGYDGIQKDIIETYARNIEDSVQNPTKDTSNSDITTHISCKTGSCITTTCDNENETCSYVTCDKREKECGSIQSCDWSTECGDSNNPQFSSTGAWIPIIAIGILAIVFIALVIYGIHKNRSYTMVARPKSFNVIAPEYLPSGSSPADPLFGSSSSYRGR